MRGTVRMLFGKQDLLLLLEQQWILQLQSLFLLLNHVLIETEAEALGALRTVHGYAAAATATVVLAPSKQ